MRTLDSLKTVGILVAGTMGAGIFALPALFRASGWATGFVYLAALGALVASVHLLYWRVLEKTNGEHRLLGLVEKFLGKHYAILGFILIVVGLVLVLLIYLLLGERFLSFLVPGLGSASVYVFWACASLPMFFGIKKVAGGEAVVALAVAGIAALLLAQADSPFALFSGKAFVFENLALPFGPTLFAVSGWVSTQTMFGFWMAKRRPGSARSLIAGGTLAILLVYAVFIMGTTGLSAADSGGINLASWADALGRTTTTLLALLGLLAVFAAYTPIALEVKNTIRKDLGFSKALSFAAVLLAPLALFHAGLTNFIEVVGLVGGVFAAIQYVLLLAVARRALEPGPRGRMLIDLGTVVFALGGVYEIYHFLFA